MSERRLAAIMFTDIIGFTSLMTLDEGKTLEILNRNLELQKPLIQKYDGKCIKEMGDGTLVCFSSAVSAVKCAIEIQEKNRKDPSYNLRIGIHVGDVIFTDNDVLGNGVNIASRLENSASPGSIFISGQVFDTIQNISGIQAEYVGKRELKNVKPDIDIYQIRISDQDMIINPIQKKVEIDNQTGNSEKTILVLPFDDMSRDRDIEYVCYGITEEITRSLSQIEELKLISNTSSYAIKKSGKTLKDIFHEMHIRYFLEGSVAKSGNNLRLNVKLIDGKSDNTIWSSKYEGSVDDIFAFQDNIAVSVTNALRIKLTPESETKITQRKINDHHVMEYYLRARQEIFQWDKNGLDNAISILSDGLKNLGDHELLYSGLGTAYWQYLNYGYSSDPALLQKMMDCARNIFRLNPQSPQGFRMLGIINYKYGNIQQAAAMFKSAWHLNPNDPVTLYFLSTVYLNGGKINEAKVLAQRLSEIDPIVPTSQLLPTYVSYMEGDFNSAYKESERVYNLFSDNPVVTFYRGLYAAAVNELPQAIQYFELNFKNHPENLYGKLSELLKLALIGSKEAVVEGISQYLSTVAFGDEELSLWMADIYALIGDNDNSLTWINNASKRGFIHHDFFARIDPFLINIRPDKRFESLISDIRAINRDF